MKVILEDERLLLLRFDKGENVLERLSDFFHEEQLTAALFTAIGAAAEVTLAYYDLVEKAYVDHELKEDLEIVSVTGNIGRMNEKPIIHAHGIFADRELQTYGGHIKKLIVSATCEVTLTILEGEIVRAHDEKTGLNLIK
jgi:predicted DNA-binding protein with PD1-like motif